MDIDEMDYDELKEHRDAVHDRQRELEGAALSTLRGRPYHFALKLIFGSAPRQEAAPIAAEEPQAAQ